MLSPGELGIVRYGVASAKAPVWNVSFSHSNHDLSNKDPVGYLTAGAVVLVVCSIANEYFVLNPAASGWIHKYWVKSVDDELK